jgi:hypothetical protein
MWKRLQVGAVLSILCGQASGGTCVVIDAFSDDDPYDTWVLSATSPGYVHVEESAGRLQFPMLNPTIVNGFHTAFAWSDGWGVDLSQDWSASVSWSAAFPDLAFSGTQTSLMFAVMRNGDSGYPIPIDGVSVAAVKTGYYPQGIDTIDIIDWSGGLGTVSTSAGRSWESTTTDFVYDASAGTLTFESTDGVGGVVWSINGTGASAWLGFGATSNGSPVGSWSGLVVAIQDICVEGAIVGAAVGACCIDAGCVQTIEASCFGTWDGAGSMCSSCAGDLDGDGAVSSADLLTLLDRFGAADCQADLDGGGVVDVFDILSLLQRWGDCG